MLRHMLRSRFARITVHALITLQVVLLAAPNVEIALIAASQQTGHLASTDMPAESPKVAVNRTVPKVTPPPSTLSFSSSPTAAEIFRAPVFPEPVVPVGGTPTAAENAALARALLLYSERGDRQWIAPLVGFIQTYPQTSWRASLLVNMAAAQRDGGAYARAMAAADGAWLLAKDATDPFGRAVADLAIAESLTIAATFGQSDQVTTRLKALGNRDIRGPAGARVARARETAAMVASRPDAIVASGPEAVRTLWALRNGDVPSAIRSRGRTDVALPGSLKNFVSTAAGTSLAQVAELARQSGLRMRAAKRTDARAVPVPAIMHWKLGHFSAVVEERGDRYHVVDVALGGSRWISRDTLLDESSGYWLLPASIATDGWSDVVPDEARNVIGHSCPDGGAPPAPPTDPPGPECGLGMPTYYFELVTASLRLHDQPTTCTSPRGPNAAFRLSYDHREELQPQIFTYGNVGPMWMFRWMRFIQEESDCGPVACGDVAVWVQLEQSGRESYGSPTGAYQHWFSKSVVVRTSVNPLRYERRLPDGTVEVYGLPNAAPQGEKRIFLTEIIDPQGQTVTLTWDEQFRVVAVTNAIGQVSTLSYEHPTDPLKLTKFTDPYGRAATLTYTAAGQLASITDVAGLTTSFNYTFGDFVAVMRTPYGATSFRHEWWNGDDRYTKRFIEATDPLGATEHAEFRWHEPTLSATAQASEVPAGFAVQNDRLDWYNTFYWDARGWSLGPGDVSKATITRWLTSKGTIKYSSPVPHSIKRPLEGRVWFKYPDQFDTLPDEFGSFRMPSVVARVLDGGQTQAWERTYNEAGLPLTITDPRGRQKSFTYASEGFDLAAVRQTTAGLNDLLASFSSYTTTHRPQVLTDTTGGTTTITYNAAGQLLTITNAKQETTSLTYNGDGRLMTMSGPITGADFSYTYDSYGRVRTATDPDGYVVTFDYDALDRLTRRTYPDGSYEAFTYDRLDLSSYRDRLGRVTRLYHSAGRRTTAIRDPLGRTIRQEWCACGSLDKLIDAIGRVTSWVRDGQGRVTSEIRNDGTTTTSYTYEPFAGRLKTVTDPKSQVRTYSYDVDNALTNVTYTGSVVATAPVALTYDSGYPRLVTMVDGTGTTNYTYHAPGQVGAGMVASIDGPMANDTLTYSYDELGRVLSRALNDITVTWAFDALGRTTSEVTPLGTFTYTYDGTTPRLASTTYPNNQTTLYTYFPNATDRRLQEIHHKSPTGATLSKFTYAYDVDGNITTWQQQANASSPVQWTYGYDAAGQFVSAVKQASDPQQTVLARLAYRYDEGGNRSAEQIDDVVTGASHDGLNRLVNNTAEATLRIAGLVSEAAAVSIDGTPASVDAANRFVGVKQLTAGTNAFTVAATDSSGNTQTKSYSVDAAGTLRSFSYDANGNLTTDGIRTFEWDAEDRLVAVKQSGNTIASFTYDTIGRRATKTSGSTTTSYVYDRHQILEERSSSGGTSRYIYGEGIDDVLAKQGTSGISYYLKDHLGSVRQITDSSGAVVLARDFDPWGNALAGATEPSVAFAGREWDPETELYYYRARYYDPKIGRFISEDPIGFAGGDVNLYRFVLDNPVNLKDPSGMDWVSASTNFVGGLAAGAAATIAVSAGIASGTIVGAAIAVGAVGVGAYQGTIAVQQLIFGIDPYTGLSLTTEERIDIAAGVAGAAVGGGLAGAGREITFGPSCRIPGLKRVAPFGNRTGNEYGELPHYHRSVPDPARPGESLPGQGSKRHRPWEPKSTDKTFWDRF